MTLWQLAGVRVSGLVCGKHVQRGRPPHPPPAGGHRQARALHDLLALALALGALRRLPPVPVVAVTDVTLVHFHFDASRDDGGSCEAVWTWNTHTHTWIS